MVNDSGRPLSYHNFTDKKVKWLLLKEAVFFACFCLFVCFCFVLFCFFVFVFVLFCFVLFFCYT